MIALLEEYLQAERDFKQVLVEMMMLGYGKTQSFNSDGGGRSENPDPTPTGEGNPLHHRWQWRWEKSRPRDRVELVRDARTDLEAWRIRCVYTPEAFDETAWIIEDGEGYDAEEVARRFNTTPSRIRSLRIRNGRDIDTGEKLQADAPAPRVQDLVERGLAARQIAMLTGTKRSTAQDAINRHRKLGQAA